MSVWNVMEIKEISALAALIIWSSEKSLVAIFPAIHAQLPDPINAFLAPEPCTWQILVHALLSVLMDSFPIQAIIRANNVMPIVLHVQFIHIIVKHVHKTFNFLPKNLNFVKKSGATTWTASLAPYPPRINCVRVVRTGCF